jgi:2-amino-4-hydroxy-6-hydroxymethyldihydropteridine diphosphokinase
MTHTVYLGIGSNVGDSRSQVLRTIALIGTIHGVTLLRASSLYQTTPVSSIPQSDFVNAACAIATTLSPEALYDALHRIEVLLGKVAKEKNAPRPIDIDILLFGNLFHHTEELTIPHPRWRTRLFVLVPLSEIVDTIIVPLDAHGTCETINVQGYLAVFPNPYQERIKCLETSSIH